MKIVNKNLGDAANVSSARGTAFKELRHLLLLACLLAVGIYFLVGLLVDAVVPRISFGREAKLFGSISWPLGEPNDPRLDRARGVLGELCADKQIPPLPYKLVLLPSNETNAFAFPGGTIGVTAGLLNSLEEDIALGFVLGHELGHFYHRDHLRGLGRLLGVGVAFGILFGGPMGNRSMGNTVQFVLDRRYSRVQEDKADQFAVELVHRVFGRTEGIDHLFQLIRQEDDLPKWAYMFATHPQPQARIDALSEYARQLD